MPTPMGRSPRATNLQMRQVRNVFKDYQMKCNCHPDSPFLWKQNPKPSIFIKDVYFRPKKSQMYDNLTKEENVIAYKQFSIHSRAHPSVKPQLNKHEI